ncbi:MAG: HAD hydrolase-like protein [Holosporaceae bacterium]|nr:HAD hydrolase-like protein [Holosporaceae bacterium]
MKIESDILSIADRYSTFFIDIYGVLFDGIRLFSKALSTLKALKQAGKKIIILSNATQVSSEAKAGYFQRGMGKGIHYDEFITSGEFLHYTIKNNPEKFSQMMGKTSNTVKCMFMGNANIFKNTHLQKGDVDNADFLYVGIPRASYGAVRVDNLCDRNGVKVNMEDVLDSDWNELRDDQGRSGLAEFSFLLMHCLQLKKTLLVANPDVFAHMALDNFHRKFCPIITQGALGAYYERLGGNVVYFGKPYPGIYEYAKQIADSDGPMIMVGDTPWTDIAGAASVGMDSALVVSTGIAGEFLQRMDSSLSIKEKCRKLFKEVAPKISKLSEGIYPNHFINRFSGIGLP